MNAVLPIGSVKRLDLKLGQNVAIQTADIHINPAWMGAGVIEGVDATGAAEEMFGSARIEGVAGQRLAALEQREPIGRHNQMQEPLFATDGAVAVRSHPLIDGNPYLKPDSSTVATA